MMALAEVQTGKSTSTKSLFTGAHTLPPIISTSDRKFFDSLQEYIQREKKFLTGSPEGPDEQRYYIYSSAFDKVIERTSAYKVVLSAIKKEYDDTISAAKTSEYAGRRTYRRLTARAAEPTAIMFYTRRAAQLRERIAIIQENTVLLRSELRRLQESRRKRRAPACPPLSPPGKIPGLSLQQSVDLATLQAHLGKLRQKLTDLRRAKQSQYISKQVMADLATQMQCAQEHRDQLAAENLDLELRHRKLAFLYEAFTSWEKSDRAIPLPEFLPSILNEISQFKVRDSDWQDVTIRASEEDDPAKDEESKLLSDYVERFTQLLGGGAFEAAALHAARSPRGILRNMVTMERFKAVRGCDGAPPPALRYFQALMVAVPTGGSLPGEELAVEGVSVALQNGCLEQVVHWVSQHRLAFSEALGDALSAHAQEDPIAADTCLALAQLVFTAVQHHSKAAASLGRRGLVHRALELLCSGAFTEDGCVSVLRSCPSAALLQALTQELQGGAAVLPLGRAARCLLESQREELLLQLLENLQATGVLQKAVLEDRCSSVEDWRKIAGRCRERGRVQLAWDIDPTHTASPTLNTSPAHTASPTLNTSPAHTVSPTLNTSPAHTASPTLHTSPAHTASPTLHTSPTHTASPTLNTSPAHSVSPALPSVRGSCTSTQASGAPGRHSAPLTETAL